MMAVSARCTTIMLTAIVALSCTVEQADSYRPDGSRSAAEVGAQAPSDEALVAAAENIVAFLRAELELEQIAVADTVTLHLSPEGGGTARKVPRDALRDSGNWSVTASGTNTTYRFAPPAGVTKLTTRPGRHMNCFETDLSSRSPELAAFPHVGTKLEPPEPASCLQGWNVTFVFDSLRSPPVLVAALYDQWEW